MALQKQGVNFNFGQGLDKKTDKNQVEAGKMLVLENAVFTKGGLLTKRNGFGNFTVLPSSASTTLNTHNSNLVATGQNLLAYNTDLDQWLTRGQPLPLDISVTPLVRTSQSQTQLDSVIAPNGAVCLVYYQGTQAYYQISDSVSGQQIQAPVALPATATHARIVLLGAYFVIVFGATVSATAHLQYIAVPAELPGSPTAATDIATDMGAITSAFDIVVYQNNMYYAYKPNSANIKYGYLTFTLAISSVKTVSAAATIDLISLAQDAVAGTIWITWHDTTTPANLNVTAIDPLLNVILTPTSLVTTATGVVRLGVWAVGAVLYFLEEIAGTYSYNATVTNLIIAGHVSIAGALSLQGVVARGLGLGSRPWWHNGQLYALTVYNSDYQPTYFVTRFPVSGTSKIIGKLAYSNGGNYLTGPVLPSIVVNGDMVTVAYQIKTLLAPINKEQDAPASAGVYTQTGVNLANFNYDSVQLSSEIAKSLHLTGGQLWQYDGVNTVEQGFALWPDNLFVTSVGTGGNLTAQKYFYQATYEWTDAAGNLFRSAPSIPFVFTTVGSTSTNTIYVPTLRVTDKTSVRIVLYRWSTGQQTYYQITSVANPLLNDPTTDSVAFVDTQADSAIVGNAIIYTTGGVVENIAAPASSGVVLYRNRMFIINAEDRDVLTYSKQVIQAVPVDFSDLFTIYVPPTTAAQGSTGAIKALAAMDDKLVIMKRDALYYITGIGPDNTGAQNDFSDPVFITSAVGTANPRSIVNTPQGIMFQSDKGIWMLDRNLNASYIGADVETYNDVEVISALLIPETTQVRFGLSDGTVLMYDYFFKQWGAFTGIPSLSACLYQNMHTYLNAFGQIRQETPGLYLDGTSPVLLKFTTAWLKLTGLQGFQRVYQLFLLSNYLTPHKLNVSIGYDFNAAVLQSTLIEPTNYSPAWGDLELWGSGEVWGGPSDVEQWRVFLDKQKCQSIQVTVEEIYDSTLGVPAGAGLTMSGINLLVGGKLSYPKPPTSGSVG